MNFDLRLPLGLIFSFYGFVLTLYGFLSDPAIYKKSLGLNVNRDWGLLLLMFGIWMLWMAHRARSKAKKQAQENLPPERP